MGRGKTELKLIKDQNKLRVTLFKRTKGLNKKAMELSVLTGAEVLLLVGMKNETMMDGDIYTNNIPWIEGFSSNPDPDIRNHMIDMIGRFATQNLRLYTPEQLNEEHRIFKLAEVKIYHPRIQEPLVTIHGSNVYRKDGTFIRTYGAIQAPNPLDLAPRGVNYNNFSFASDSPPQPQDYQRHELYDRDIDLNTTIESLATFLSSNEMNNSFQEETIPGVMQEHIIDLQPRKELPINPTTAMVPFVPSNHNEQSKHFTGRFKNRRFTAQFTIDITKYRDIENHYTTPKTPFRSIFMKK